MWIATKSFYFRGKFFKSGERLTEAQVASRSVQLVKLHRICWVDGASPVESEAPPPPPEVKISDMKRDELNEYARAHGINDPLEYSKKEDLVAALEKLAEDETETSPEEDNETNKEEGTGSGDDESSVEDSQSDEESDPVDDLFADTNQEKSE